MKAECPNKEGKEKKSSKKGKSKKAYIAWDENEVSSPSFSSSEDEKSNLCLMAKGSNVSDLTPFSAGLPNLWTNSLPPEEHDENLEESASTDLAQPSRRMSRSITQDRGLGQDSSLANASAPSMPQRITRSRAQALGAKH